MKGLRAAGIVVGGKPSVRSFMISYLLRVLVEWTHTLQSIDIHFINLIAWINLLYSIDVQFIIVGAVQSLYFIILVYGLASK